MLTEKGKEPAREIALADPNVTEKFKNELRKQDNTPCEK